MCVSPICALYKPCMDYHATGSHSEAIVGRWGQNNISYHSIANAVFKLLFNVLDIFKFPTVLTHVSLWINNAVKLNAILNPPRVASPVLFRFYPSCVHRSVVMFRRAPLVNSHGYIPQCNTRSGFKRRFCSEPTTDHYIIIKGHAQVRWAISNIRYNMLERS